MSTTLLDSEFMENWSLLNDEEKLTLITTAKGVVESGERGGFPADLQRCLVLEERDNYLRSEGLSYGWETVKKKAQGIPRGNRNYV